MAPNGSRDFRSLDPCVHCGFCLSACPTYLATGDESDSPRGRIVLMRGLERGEIAPTDPGLRDHIDACLGCRGCEPACPSGVGYGAALEVARSQIAEAAGISSQARAVLGIFRRRWLWSPLLSASRWLRHSGIPKRLAGRRHFGFMNGMLAATAPVKSVRGTIHDRGKDRGTVALFRGCVMDRLFGHVHEATVRTLRHNGYRVVEIAHQSCCGALHLHAGDEPGARTLGQEQVRRLSNQADYLVANSAGCGAFLKDLGHFLNNDEARRLSASVRDVSELLEMAGPVTGAPLAKTVWYDAPCHLQHAQQVVHQPIAMLRAVPGLEVKMLPGSDRCCGAAGIYGLLHPELSRAVLDDKIGAIIDVAGPSDLVATGNPGCLMQIGAGLLAVDSGIRVVHPVEILDWSYQQAGAYD